MPRPLSPTSVEQRIRAKLRQAPNAEGLTLVGATDFTDVGSRRAIDLALHRLTEQGAVKRLARGLYYVPRVHPILGEMRPTPDAIVTALVAKHHLRAQPSGAYAANLLGLSDQVPMRVVYLTDGPSRRILIGPQEVVLKRTTPKNMASAGRISGLVIQALRYLGKQHVGRSVVAKLRKRLEPKERAQLLEDAELAPAWIGEVMRQISSTKAG